MWIERDICEGKNERHTRRVSHLTFLLFLIFAFRLLPISGHSLPKKSQIQIQTVPFSAFSVESRMYAPTPTKIASWLIATSGKC